MQPASGDREIRWDKFVPRILNFHRDLRACGSQGVGEPLCIFQGDDGIMPPGADERLRPAQIRNWRRRERNHGSKENRRRQYLRAEKQYGRGNVGPVRIANRGQFRQGKTVFGRSGQDEIDQLVCSAHHVFFIKDALGKATEKASIAVLRTVPRGLNNAASGSSSRPSGSRSDSSPPVPCNNRRTREFSAVGGT